MIKFLGKESKETRDGQGSVDKKTRSEKISRRKKRVRKYQPLWDLGRLWLLYDKKGKVLCKFCRGLYGLIGELATKKMKLGQSVDHNNDTKLASGSLVVGCTNLKEICTQPALPK